MHFISIVPFYISHITSCWALTRLHTIQQSTSTYMAKMADPGDNPKPARRNTSGTSRNSSPKGLGRVLSGTHLDDQHYGHHYHHDTEAIDDSGESTDGPELTEKESEDNIDLGAEVSEESEIKEVRDGVLDDRDIESGKLSKSRTGRSAKSSRSARDPNLVSWEGPEDPENPKNWKFSRKWAATLVGKSTVCYVFW